MTNPVRFKYPEGLDPNEKLAFGIGHLIMEWAGCESLFYGILECLLGRDKTENALIVWLSLRTTEGRLSLIRQLSKVQDTGSASSAEIIKLCDRFKGVSGVRNFYCHAHYRAGLDGALHTIENTKLVAETQPIYRENKRLDAGTLNEVANTIRQAHRLNVDAWNLIVRLRETTKTHWLELPAELPEYLRIRGTPADQENGA